MNEYWAFGSTADPHQLATEVLYDHQFETEFADLTGEQFFKYWGTGIKGEWDSENPLPGSMIKEYTNLKSGHGFLEIPVIVPNKKNGVYGDADLKTLGQQDEIVWMNAGINRIQFAHKLVKGLQAQILGTQLTAALNQGQQDTKNRLNLSVDKDLYHTALTGTSMGMSSLNPKLNVRAFNTPHSHANFWTPQGGMVPKISGALPGSAGYETAVVGALQSVGVNDKMTAKVIKQLELQALYAKIPYFQTKAGKRRILILSEPAYAQLREDPEYIEAQKIPFYGMGWEAPQLSNYRGQFSQSLIFSSVMFPGVRMNSTDPGDVAINTAANSMPYYTPDDTWYEELEVVDYSPLRMGLLVGPDMILKAYGNEALTFRSYIDTSSETELIILSVMMAYVLSDMWDKDGHITGTANDFYANRSSMAFATWSPLV